MLPLHIEASNKKKATNGKFIYTWRLKVKHKYIEVNPVLLIIIRWKG